MRITGVEVVGHDGTTTLYEVADGRDPEDWLDYAVDQGNYSITVFTDDGGRGFRTPHTILSIPFTEVRSIRTVWSDPDPLEVAHFLKVTVTP